MLISGFWPLLISLYIAITALPNVTFAQTRLDWLRLFAPGGVTDCELNDVYPLLDNGILLCGRAVINQHNKTWVIKTDRNGDTTWTAIIGGEQTDAIAYSCIELDDGDLAIGGFTDNVENDIRQFAATKLAADGQFEWTRCYEPGGGDQHRYGCCQAIIELKSGNLLMAGLVSTRSNGAGDRDGFLVKTDQAGGPIWIRSYGDANHWESFYGLRETDNGYFIAGRLGIDDGNTGGLNDYWALKVDEDGEMVWNRTYGGQGNQTLTSMVTTRDGGMLLAGWTGSVAINDNILLVRIDNNGNADWERTIDMEGDLVDGRMRRENIASVARLSSGNFAVVGSIGLTRNQVWSQYALSFSVSVGGNEIWRRVDRQIANEANQLWFRSVVEGLDEGIFAVGQATINNEAKGILFKITVLPQEPQIVTTIPDTFNLAVLLGDSIRFVVSAIDFQEDSISYSWLSGQELLSNDSTFSRVFSQLGVDTITCVVSDGVYSTFIRWSVVVRDLFIASYSPDTLSLFLRRGTSQTFSLDTVRAVEGDPLQYQWTLTNLDNFEREETGTEASATIEFLRSGNYQMEGLAYRGESSDNVIWTIAVRSAILDFWPRELRLSVPPDSSGAFGVIPFNPESDSLIYRWEVDGDSVGSDSTVTLRFARDDRWIGNPPHLVSAIVMDGVEGDTIRWEVTVLDPNATPPTPPSIEGGESPTTFGITSVSPNPFNNSTTIHFTVPFGSESAQSAKSAVRLTVHDLTGREVARLVDERAQQSPPSRGGPYAVTFDGRELPAGVYLVRLDSRGIKQTVKVVLVR